MSDTTTQRNIIRLGERQVDSPKNRSRFIRGFARNRFAVVGLGIVLTMIFIAIFAPIITDKDPNKTNYTAILQPPSEEHPLGTDEYGRDMFSRLAHGAQISLLIAFMAQSVTVSLGVAAGLVAGWYGGWIDDLIMRIADGFFAIFFASIDY